MIDFPASPAIGQIYIAPSGQTWMWDGMAWVQQHTPAAPVVTHGLVDQGIVTGALGQAQTFNRGIILGSPDPVNVDSQSGALRLYRDPTQMLAEFSYGAGESTLSFKSGTPPTQYLRLSLDTDQTESPIGDIRVISPLANRGKLNLIFQPPSGVETGVTFEEGSIDFKGANVDIDGNKIVNIGDATDPQDAVALHQLSSKEDDLGLPAQTGMMLVSTAAGVRSWAPISGAPDYTGATTYATAMQQEFQNGIKLPVDKSVDWENSADDSKASLAVLTGLGQSNLRLFFEESSTAVSNDGTIELLYANKDGQNTSVKVDNNGVMASSNIPGAAFDFGGLPGKNMADGVDPDDAVTFGQLSAKEDLLGNPTTDGMVLVSTTAGVRAWTSLGRPDYTGATTYATIQSQRFTKGITIPQGELLNLGGGELWTDTNGNVELIHIDPADAGSVRLISRGTETSEIDVSPNGIGIQSSYPNAIVDFNSLRLHNIADGTSPQDAVSLSQLNSVSPDYTGATPYATTQAQRFENGLTIAHGQLLNIGGGELWTDTGGNVELILIDPTDAGSVRLIARGTETSEISASSSGISLESSYANAVVNFNSLKLHNIADGTLPQDAVSLSQLDTKEDSLGDPATDGMVLASTAAGVRSWAALPSYLLSDGSANGATAQSQTFSEGISIPADKRIMLGSEGIIRAVDNGQLEIIHVDNTDATELQFVFFGSNSHLSDIKVGSSGIAFSSDFPLALIDAGGMKIRDVADGTLPTDAVNLGQLPDLSGYLPIDGSAAGGTTMAQTFTNGLISNAIVQIRDNTGLRIANTANSVHIDIKASTGTPNYLNVVGSLMATSIGVGQPPSETIKLYAYERGAYPSMSGVYGVAISSGDGGWMTGVNALGRISGAHSWDYVYGIQAEAQINNGTVDHAYGLSAKLRIDANAIVSNDAAAIHIGAITDRGQTVYALKSRALQASILAGALGVGMTTAPLKPLHVKGDDGIRLERFDGTAHYDITPGTTHLEFSGATQAPTFQVASTDYTFANNGLYLKDSDTGFALTSFGKQIVIENNTHEAGIQFLSPVAGRLAFSSSTTANDGGLLYDAPNREMIFKAGAGDRAVLRSYGLTVTPGSTNLSGASVNTQARALVVDHSGNAGISIYTPSTNNSALYFGDEVDNDRSGFQQDNTNRRLNIRAQGSWRGWFDAYGFSVVRTTVPSSSTVPAVTRDLTISTANVDSGIAIATDAGHYGSVTFANQHAPINGQIRYVNDTQTMDFVVGNTTSQGASDPPVPSQMSLSLAGLNISVLPTRAVTGTDKQLYIDPTTGEVFIAA